MAGKSVVSVRRVDDGIREAVRSAMDAAGFEDAIPRGRAVAIKPNLGWDLFIPGSVTSPPIIEAVLERVAERTREIYLVESGQVLEDVERVRRRLKLDAILARWGARWVNLSKSPRVAVRVPGHRVFPEIGIPAPLDRALLITVPVLKTHDKTLLSGAIKNQWGCIPEFRHNFHLVLDAALVDILSVLPPCFAVMDATVGLEGDGPKSGFPRILDLVLASADPVAIDWIEGQIMGYGPHEVRHVALAAEAGLGQASPDSVTVEGLELASIKANFQRPRSNLVSQIELSLRRSSLRRLVFETPLFQLCLAGAKAWYYGWYWLGGGKRRSRAVLAHPRYGPIWREYL